MTLEDALATLEATLAELTTSKAELKERDVALKERDSVIEKVESENANLAQEKKTLDCKVELLKEQLNDLLQRLYGKRSERYEAPGQQDLFDDLLELPKKPKDDPEPELQDVSYRRRPPKVRGPKPLPAHLERVRLPVDPSEKELTCACCRDRMERVGETITEELDIVPEKFFVTQLVQGKFRCRKCMNRDVMRELPPRPIQNGRPSPGVLAYIVTAKYVDHQPLYRQEQIFKRQGVSIPRSTMNGWLSETSKLLAPIAEALKRDLLRESFLQVDETTIQVQHPEVKGKTKRCYIWAYAKPGGEVFYNFTESRSGRHPDRMLRDFQGVLQTDGFSGYGRLWQRGLVHVACMAHIRRGFYEQRERKPREVKAILGVIRRLYRLERLAKTFGVTGERLAELRHRRAEPLFEKLKSLIDELGGDVLPKSKLGGAVRYAQGQWPAMLRYLDTPRAPLDNNGVENAIRPLALGRKNFLFLGSPEAGGERVEVFSSLVESCRRLGLDPHRYLRSVILLRAAMPDGPSSALTPAAWKKALVRAENAPAPSRG